MQSALNEPEAQQRLRDPRGGGRLGGRGRGRGTIVAAHVCNARRTRGLGDGGFL